MTDRENDAYDHYRILRREQDGSLWILGSGGMGTTYKAVDTNLDSFVALKVIKADLLKDPVARDRFIREAKAAASLRHTNVAAVYHRGEANQRYFYAMEFVSGETVEERVKRLGPFPVMTALRLVHQVARALSAAHRNGLVHRDIKPANLMFVEAQEGESEVLKLIDFGLAKSVNPDGLEHHLTRPGHLPGFSPFYACPEQCEYADPDTRGDIYSLGATLWFMLTGQPPFLPTTGKREKEQVFELQTKHVTEAPPLAKLTAAGVPAVVCGLLGRMLEKNPGARPQTPADLRVEIETCLGTLEKWAEPAPKPAYSFSLADLLRKRGYLAWPEMPALLPRLAAIADDLAASGSEALANFVPGQIHVVFPSWEDSAAASDAGHPVPDLEQPSEWLARGPDFQLVSHIGDETRMAATGLLTATQSSPPRRFRDASEALAALVYELLDGQPPDGRPGVVPGPLTRISEAGNELLRAALMDDRSAYRGSAKQFAEALENAVSVLPPPGNPLPPQLHEPPLPIPPRPLPSAGGSKQLWSSMPAVSAREKVMGKLVLLLVALGVAGLGFFGWRSKVHPPAPPPVPGPTLTIILPTPSTVATSDLPSDQALRKEIDDGESALRIGDYESALAAYQKAHALDADSGEAKLGLEKIRAAAAGKAAEGKRLLAQDASLALPQLREAALLGNSDAQVNLGCLYEQGRGGLKMDAARAVELYRQAAAQGDANGQAYLGVLYENGKGGLKADAAKAVELFRLSAAQGNANGQVDLGAMYEQGKGGLKMDAARAMELYRQAAAQGNALALAFLGDMYQYNERVPPNRQEAVYLNHKAAAQGSESFRDRQKGHGDNPR